MVQGKTKGLKLKAESSRHAQKAAANTKKGQRAIPPKKTALVKQAALHKVDVEAAIASVVAHRDGQTLSAKINKSVEQQMVNAASSGKLTIMKNVADEELVLLCYDLDLRLTTHTAV